MKLHSRIHGLIINERKILRISETLDRPADERAKELLLGPLPSDGNGKNPFGLVIARRKSAAGMPSLPEDLGYLKHGDIVRVFPNGDISVLYRKDSRHNVIFMTERCNSKCLMCSQPPRDIDDEYLAHDWLKAIPLMSQETKVLGISGGEPTLYLNNLLKVIEAAKIHLPSTSLHMLSNGRLFSYLSYARALAELKHPDLVVGIPLYSDSASKHDFVVQAKGAFEQTVRGLLNLARVGQKTEVRIVIHKQTYKRLPQTARFIARNLPVVGHVALMGLEITGYTRTNLNAMWIDPLDYQTEISAAVDELRWGKMNFSIYNLPLCLLPQSLWSHARASISDWKNIYYEACESCSVKSYCGGFFASSVHKASLNIRPLGIDKLRFAKSLWSGETVVGLASSKKAMPPQM